METDLSCLRNKLKQWEREFAATHGGQKAGREDIRQNPDIASKYKAYDRLRRSSTSKKGNGDSQKSLKRSDSSKENGHDVGTVTPHKRLKTSHSGLQLWNVDPYDPPISFLLSPSRARTSIGPTPQKDGKVLGLFDALSSASKSKTPSKRKALLPIAANVQATPSKAPTVRLNGRCTADVEGISESQEVHPFATPSRKQAGQEPSSIVRRSASKENHDETPAFLRRGFQVAKTASTCRMDSIDDASLSSPVAIRKLVMPIGRGLSTLVKNLRDMEDERLDEELDIMRELEAGDEATGPPKEKKQTPMLLVEDSQQAEMPLGPDQAPESEEEEDEGNYTRDGRPLKIWKKKGQRRTTRRVNMKPSTAKWKPEPQWNAANGSDSEVEGHTNMVNDTELDPSNQAQTAQNSDSDSDVHQGDERPSASDEKEPQNGRKRTGQKAKETTKQGTDAKSLGQKLKRKMISATAHANFRSLKIRNKNSKGRSGRFGRRR